MSWRRCCECCLSNSALGRDSKGIDYGLTASAKSENTGYKFLRITDIQDGAVDWPSVPFCEAPSSKLRSAALDDGDIVFARTGATTGKSFLIESPPAKAVFASYLIRVRPSKSVSSSFLAHFFQSTKYWSQIRLKTQGAAQGGVNATSLGGLSIPLPPLDEQRRIAAILDKADALRRKRKRALELLDGLPQSIFLEMFGDLVTSSRFQRRPVSDWVEDFETGKNLAPDPDADAADAFRVLKVSAVTSGSFDAAEAKPLPASYSPPPSHLVQQGDLLFSRANTSELIGAVAYVAQHTERLVLPDKIWRFCWRADNEPHPLFIHTLFSTPKFRYQISKRSTGTSGSMKNISKGKVLSIQVGQPTRAQQNEFVERASVAVAARVRAAQQRDLIDTQFASLQHRAFSGQL